jgi:hypothetical protein
MARYYFHLRDSIAGFEDGEGVELGDLDAARVTALRAARDTLSQGLKSGVLDLRYRIEVEEDGGAIVHTLQLADAFKTIRED